MCDREICNYSYLLNHNQNKNENITNINSKQEKRKPNCLNLFQL